MQHSWAEDEDSAYCVSGLLDVLEQSHSMVTGCFRHACRVHIYTARQQPATRRQYGFSRLHS